MLLIDFASVSQRKSAVKFKFGLTANSNLGIRDKSNLF
jgi:hypothetical protein